MISRSSPAASMTWRSCSVSEIRWASWRISSRPSAVSLRILTSGSFPQSSPVKFVVFDFYQLVVAVEDMSDGNILPLLLYRFVPALARAP